MISRGIHSALRGCARHRLGRRAGIVALLMVMALLVAACDSTNTYPIDFFSEMHYTAVWHAQEPPRLDSPSSAVAYKGGNDNVGGALGTDGQMARAASAGSSLYNALPNYSAEEAANLQNPLERNEQTSQMGAQLFAVNCTVCHGAEGAGDGIAAALIFQANNQPVPANLQQRELLSPVDNQPKELTDGELYYVIANGYGGLMPPFGHLLTQEQIWALVNHIRELQGQ